MKKIRFVLTPLLLLLILWGNAQPPSDIQWSADGNSYYESGTDGIVQYQLPSFSKTTLVAKSILIPEGKTEALQLRNFFFSDDAKKLLIYTNTKKVWRLDTRGDYWILDLTTKKLKQLGKKLPESSLMFAKFSPDGNKVAYVSKHNIYMEDLKTGIVKQLTKNGTDRMINGTFDWVYEEEFGCRDGFRWSPDSKGIAFWQIDATKIRNFLMINNTDSIYSFVVPVEYPKVGESPSPCRVGVIDISSGAIKMMNVPGDARQHYIPRMEWAYNSSELILQQLNRKQNKTSIFICNAKTGAAKPIYTESDKAWIDIKSYWNHGDPAGWDWLDNGKSFLWVSEKDGWRHIYRLTKDGRETLITKGNYDIISLEAADEKAGYLYFSASPENATQKYLYKIKSDGSSDAELVSSKQEKGTHNYSVSPTSIYAEHSFSNINTSAKTEWINLSTGETIKKASKGQPVPGSRTEFFQVITEEGITMDGWITKPRQFDSTKKYPVIFYVYTEPAGATVTDSYGASYNFLYAGSMVDDGYIQISLDGRGTPAPKGAAWRKAIYKNIGRVNIRDQALAAKKILQWPYVDTSRIAVWGWSGGASATLNLLFQYPEIYKTGIAVASVAYQLTYDNIYQERYMGLPQENMEDFIKGSPLTYAKNLKGHLLYVHGTGDDNVHYQNAEMLINELVKYQKQFQLMIYPNRTHSISEGEGTFDHLSALYTQFLQTWCPGGGR